MRGRYISHLKTMVIHTSNSQSASVLLLPAMPLHWHGTPVPPKSFDPRRPFDTNEGDGDNERMRVAERKKET